MWKCCLILQPQKVKEGQTEKTWDRRGSTDRRRSVWKRSGVEREPKTELVTSEDNRLADPGNALVLIGWLLALEPVWKNGVRVSHSSQIQNLGLWSEEVYRVGENHWHHLWWKSGEWGLCRVSLTKDTCSTYTYTVSATTPLLSASLGRGQGRLSLLSYPEAPDQHVSSKGCTAPELSKRFWLKENRITQAPAASAECRKHPERSIPPPCSPAISRLLGTTLTQVC